MARSRNIKPGFFTNDAMADLPALTRLLFIGIWTLADRCGRLEDRPRKIKAECMPYDDMDADKAVEDLVKAGFLVRYEAGEIRCIQVQNWDKHQSPHMKEQPSSLPAPYKHGASTAQASDKPDESTEVAGLIPDSGFLIPEKNTHTTLAREFVLPKAWGQATIDAYPHWTHDVVRSIAGTFCDHHWSAGTTSADWQAAWRKWCSDPLTQKAHPPPKPPRAAPTPPKPTDIASITTPFNDTRGDEFKAHMDRMAAERSPPPAHLLAQRVAK